MNYNLKRKAVENLKIVTKNLSVVIKGIYYCDKSYPLVDVDNRYDLDIEEIIWDGKNVVDLLDFLEAKESIENEIIRYAPNYFTESIAS